VPRFLSGRVQVLLVTVARLEAQKSAKRQPMSPLILRRIQDGAHDSPHMQRKLRSLVPPKVVAGPPPGTPPA
jgi:hypothetical protein